MESTSPEHQHDAPSARQGISCDLVALLSQIDKAAGGEGHTTAEIADILGCGPDKARKVIKDAIARGVCRASRKKIMTIMGTTQMYPSYVFEEVKG